MRLILSFRILAFLFFLFLCQTIYAQHRCATMQAMETLYQQDGDLQKKIEEHIAHIHKSANQKALEKGSEACAEGGTITIPVVVHVLYDPNNPATNISEAQIESQICQLNADFGGTNQDLAEALDGDGNKDVASQIAAATSDGTCIQFCLATFDHPTSAALNPDGLTDGQKAIVRRSLAGLPTDFPPSYSNTPGDDDIWEISPIWDRDEYLNFWIVPSISIGANGSNNILGFAQLPNGPANTDGITIRAQNFGSSSPDCGPCTGCFLQSNFNWGRTATHEVGHWLSLFHTWGTGNSCSEAQGDGIADTPNQFQSSSEFFCNTSADGFSAIGDQCTPVSQGGIMYMNYMDYSADACLILFSEGQQAAMEQTLNVGFRSNFGTNDLGEVKCTPITDPPIAGFTYSPNPAMVCNINGKIKFTDTSEDNPTQWTWSFTVLNGDISLDIVASSSRNPIVEVLSGTSGTIEAELVAANSLGEDTATETITITVSEDACPSCDGGIFAGADMTVCLDETVTLTPTLGTIGGTGDVATATIGSTDLTGALQNCVASVPQGSIDVVPFAFDVSPVNGSLTEAGPGSILQLCVNITVTNNSGTYISLDHANGSYENLWIGSALGGSNGNGGTTIDVCFTAGEASGTFDGIFDGNSGSGSFVGQASQGPWVLYIEDFGCFFNGGDPPTVNSATLTIDDSEGGLDCQFLRWEVSGVEVSTNSSFDVTPTTGGTIFYTAVADCEGFICTDDIAISTLSSGTSSVVGTADNPFEVCGNEDSFEMTSTGPYSYNELTQTVAWGFWVIEDPFQQTSLDADLLPGSPPNDNDVSDDDNFLGYYGTGTMGTTGEGTVSLPVEGDGVTYYLAPIIINLDNTIDLSCAAIGTQGTYVRQYIELDVQVLPDNCSENPTITSISIEGGKPLSDFIANNPDHTETYTLSMFNNDDPMTELIPESQQVVLWDEAMIDFEDLPFGSYTLTIEDGAGCQVMREINIGPDCEADELNQIDYLNGPPVQTFTDINNRVLEAADDFIVGSGGMVIDAVQVGGSFSNVRGAVVENVQVIISVDFFGEPGPNEVLNVTIEPTDPTDPNFHLPLDETLELGAGKYWISVIPELSFADHRQWYWGANADQSGDKALFRDETDLLGSGFTDWVPVNGNVGNANANDLSFALLSNASAGTPEPLENNLLCCGDMIDVNITGAKYDCTSLRLAWAVAPSNDLEGVQAAINSAAVLFATLGDSYSLLHSCTDGLDAGTYYVVPFLANKREATPMLLDECSIIGDGLQIGLTDPIEADDIGFVCTLNEDVYNIVVSGLRGGANNGGNPVLEGAEYVFADANGELTATYDSMNDTYKIENVNITDFNAYTLSISDNMEGQNGTCGADFNGFTAPDCCAPEAGLPNAPTETVLCSDGTGEWSFAAADGFSEMPSDGTTGTPDYVYIITSSGTISIIQAISADGSYTATKAGEFCVYGMAYNAAAFDLIDLDLENYVGQSTFALTSDLDDGGFCYALSDDAVYCLEALAPIEGVLVSIDCAADGLSGTLNVDLSNAVGGGGSIAVAADSPDKDGDTISDFPYSYTVNISDAAGCELTLTGTVNCDVACTPDAGVLTAPMVTEGCLTSGTFTFAAPTFASLPSGFGADAYVYLAVSSSNAVAAVSEDGVFAFGVADEYCIFGLKYDDGGSVNPSNIIGSSLSSLVTALNNASVCYDLTDDSYCVNTYGAIENVVITSDCAMGGESGTLQIDLSNATGGSGSGYAVTDDSFDKDGDELTTLPYNYTVIVTDDFGCTTSLFGSVTCESCPSISSISDDAEACSGDNVSLSVTIDDPDNQLDRIEWTSNGSVVGTGASIEASETVSGCSNSFVTYTATAICSDGFEVSEDVIVTYYPEVSATASLSSDGCTISFAPDCPQFVIEGFNAGQTAVVTTDIDGDNSAVSFNVSNPNAPMGCNSATVSENYDCILPECPTIGSIVELGKSAVDFSICSEDVLQLQASINDPNNQLDRLEWTAASLPEPVMGTQINISEMIAGCEVQTFTYTLTAYCQDGSAATETVNITVYPLPDADVELLDGGCLLRAVPTCPDFAINGNAAGETVSLSAEPGDQSPVTFDVVNTTASSEGVDCGTMQVTANFNCATCASNVGTMPQEEVWICDGEQTNVQTSGETVGMGEVLTYILHDSPSTTIGQVLAQNNMGQFDANDATTLDRYYISAIVGPDADGNGTPDLENPCTSVASGTPVRFLNSISYAVEYSPNATSGVDATFSIVGGASEVDGSAYTLSLSTGQMVSNAVHNTPFTIEGLANMETITLDVSDSNGCSNSFVFTDIEEENLLANSLIIKPIPAKDFLQLDFHVAKAATAKVNLYSVDGQLLLEKSQLGKIGTNILELNLQSLPSGMYFLSLEYDGSVVNRKVVVGD